MCEIADISTIITAEKYLERIDRPRLPGRVLLADVDLLPRVSKARTLARMLRLPYSTQRRYDRAHCHDVATVVFSSGTTGDPKGVQLTHAQILANIASVEAGIGLHEAHVLLSALPLFHSFGLVPGMWLGLVTGITISAFPNPRDPVGLGRHAERSSATCMLSTPTFCRQYLKKITPAQFATLQFAIVAAEKCPDELREAFHARFRARLLEGYGCTELAPIVSTNTPDTRPPDTADDGHSPGSRDGSVGRPLPGIEVLIVDPDTLEELAPGREGMIIVRSAARMLGYLKRDDLTDEAFVLGGYRTGDIGRLDEDGFLYITGRLARFAKIGGEMVPLDTVEERLDSYLRKHYEDSEVEVAMAAVPDTAKGERLVLLHTGLPCDAAAMIEQALTDLPPLFRPRPRDVYEVPEMPALGSGKRDLKGVAALAKQIAGQNARSKTGAGA
jgi:acyl-[acyl-carrier-protein]-phospholipid O-acyltransferase/long-chain-fatty-acid--[acyl-carrier-protein] ligase